MRQNKSKSNFWRYVLPLMVLFPCHLIAKIKVGDVVITKSGRPQMVVAVKKDEVTVEISFRTHETKTYKADKVYGAVKSFSKNGNTYKVGKMILLQPGNRIATIGNVWSDGTIIATEPFIGMYGKSERRAFRNVNEVNVPVEVDDYGNLSKNKYINTPMGKLKLKGIFSNGKATIGDEPSMYYSQGYQTTLPLDSLSALNECAGPMRSIANKNKK